MESKYIYRMSLANKSIVIIHSLKITFYFVLKMVYFHNCEEMNIMSSNHTVCGFVVFKLDDRDRDLFLVFQRKEEIF